MGWLDMENDDLIYIDVGEVRMMPPVGPDGERLPGEPSSPTDMPSPYDAPSPTSPREGRLELELRVVDNDDFIVYERWRWLS